MAANRPTTIFNRVATCPPVLFSLSSLFLLGGAAAVLPSVLSGLAVSIAFLSFLYTVREAKRNAEKNCTSEMPYFGQFAANLSVSAVTAANIVQEKGTEIAQQLSTQPLIEATITLGNDQPLLHAVGLAFAYALGASGAWLKIDSKRRKEKGLSPRGRVNSTETHWSLADVAVNIVSPAATVTGLAGVGLSLFRRPEHDTMTVTGPITFAVKHVTSLRVISFSYAVAAPVMFILSPLSCIGVLLDIAGSCFYDGEDKPLNRDLPRDLRIAGNSLARTASLGLTAASLVVAGPVRARALAAPVYAPCSP